MKLSNMTFAAAMTAAAMTMAVAGPVSAEIPETTLEMAHIYNPGNIWYRSAERYAEAVKERTDGKVTINISPSGMTGSWQEAIEALQIGTNQIVLQSVGTLDRYDPLPGVESFPYLLRDLDHYKAVYNGPVGKELFDEIEERTGFKIIGAGYRGARKLSANKKVVDLADLKGIKLRVPPLKMYRRTWELLDASPTPLPATEMYTALQQGVIDGQENPLEVILNYKLYEHQSHIMSTDHVTGAMTFIFDSATFHGYPEELQTVLQEEGDKVMRWATDQMVAEEAQYREELENDGVTFVEPNRAAFREAVAPIKDEFPELKPWVERIQAVQ